MSAPQEINETGFAHLMTYLQIIETLSKCIAVIENANKGENSGTSLDLRQTVTQVNQLVNDVLFTPRPVAVSRD